MALHAPHDQQWSSEIEALRFGYYAQPQVDHKFAPQVWEGNQRTTLAAAADGMTGISPRTGPSEGGTAVLVTGVDFARYLNTSYLDSSEVEPRAPPDAASAAAAALALAAGFGAPRELQRCLLGGAEVDPEELHRGQLVVRHTGAEASVAIRSSAQLVCTTSRLGSAGLEGSLSLDFDQAPGAEAEAAAAAAAAAGAGAGAGADAGARSGAMLELRGNAAAGSGVLALGGAEGDEGAPQWGGAVVMHLVQAPPWTPSHPSSTPNPNSDPNRTPDLSPNPIPQPNADPNANPSPSPSPSPNPDQAPPFESFDARFDPNPNPNPNPNRNPNP